MVHFSWCTRPSKQVTKEEAKEIVTRIQQIVWNDKSLRECFEERADEYNISFNCKRSDTIKSSFQFFTEFNDKSYRKVTRTPGYSMQKNGTLLISTCDGSRDKEYIQLLVKVFLMMQKVTGGKFEIVMDLMEDVK